MAALEAPASDPPDGADEADLLRREIGELRATLSRLRASEAMYRYSAEVSRRLVWTTDAEGRITALSRLFRILAGIDDEDLSRVDLWQAVDPSDTARVKQAWEEKLACGEPLDIEFRALLSDGSRRLVRALVYPARDVEGRIRKWYGSIEDVEEERRSEQARMEAERRLRQSEELHRFTLELTRQIVWTARPDGSERSYSSRYAEYTGLPSDAAGRDVLHPDDYGPFMEVWNRALASGQPFATDARLRSAEGEYRYFRIRAAPLRGEAGEIVRWYGISEDVHEEHLAEQARRDVEERYRLAVKATNDAVWDYDLLEQVVDWSENSAAVLGLAGGIARTTALWWQERLHPQDRWRVMESLDRAIRLGRDRWSMPYRFQRDDGTYADLLDRGFIIRDRDGTARRMVGAITDLTERKRAEDEISRIQSELIHVSRLSAMGAMASTLAHELNQPLAAVSNYISGARRLALQGGAPGEELFTALDWAEAGAQRAGEIVRRLRELVSHRARPISVENLPALIEEAGVLAFVDERQRGVSHRISLDPDAEWVKADRVQVEQVLINLVRNAMDAMKDSEVREITLSTRALRNEIEISVADTGTGLPEDKTTLFSRFITTKSEGMGIGLAISRTIVELHGGKIWGEDRPDGGAVFRFTLPRAAAPPRAPDCD